MTQTLHVIWRGLSVHGAWQVLHVWTSFPKSAQEEDDVEETVRQDQEKLMKEEARLHATRIAGAGIINMHNLTSINVEFSTEPAHIPNPLPPFLRSS